MSIPESAIAESQLWDRRLKMFVAVCVLVQLGTATWIVYSIGRVLILWK